MAPTAVLAEEVTCASVKNARTECPMKTRGEVRLVRQLSKAPSTDGVTWGLSKHSVWVEKGCRAVFSNAQDNASMPDPSSHGLPGFDATCPGNTSVHGDDGGYVYVNGNAASVKKFNDNYYESKGRCRGLPGSLPRRDPAGWIAARDDCRSGRGQVHG